MRRRYRVTGNGAGGYSVIDTRYDPPHYVDWHLGYMSRYHARRKAARLNSPKRKEK